MTVQVQEFSSADALMAHYRALEERKRQAFQPPRRAATVQPIKPKPAPLPPPVTENGRTIYAWAIGPRHTRDVLYVATPPEGKVSTAHQIIREVCAKHGFSITEIKSQRRQQVLCRARHEIFYRMKTETGMSFPQMGAIMGNRDHTTALHSFKRYERMLADGVVK